VTGDETVIVYTRHISCNGGGANDHPKIYLEIGKTNKAECPYCSKVFILEECQS